MERGMLVRERVGAPTILWIHGLGESGRCFDDVIAHPALAATGALIPDLPGYGRSEQPREPMTLDRVADHLAGWLRGRGAPAVTVVGHSMGGVIGVLLAERHPDRVARVIDVDGNVSIGDCVYSRRIAAGQLAELQADIEERGRTHAGSASYARSLPLADAATLAVHAAELLAVSAAETMAPRLAALAVPTTYVAGVPDGASARSLALLDAAGVPRVDIAPAGHFVFSDQPDAFAYALATLL